MNHKEGKKFYGVYPWHKAQHGTEPALIPPNSPAQGLQYTEEIVPEEHSKALYKVEIDPWFKKETNNAEDGSAE